MFTSSFGFSPATIWEFGWVSGCMEGGTDSVVSTSIILGKVGGTA